MTWLAITALAVGYILGRTLANVRSWRAGERLHPAPVRDPEWAAKRTDSIFAPGRVECGVSVQDWWCRLLPGHSGGCIPRRDEEPRS